MKAPEKSGLPDLYVSVHIVPGTIKVERDLFVKTVYLL